MTSLHYLLDKDGELVCEQLTVEKRQEFQKMLTDGRIGHLMDNYTPWWNVLYSQYSVYINL